MTGALPEWRPFDPDAAEPSGLELPGAGGRALAILASPSLDRNGWAGRAAVRLARGRAERSGRLMLADLGFDRPRLHTLLNTANDEGVTDALLYGGSIQRIARPVRGGFVFAPAGTAVADSKAVLTHDRWDAVIDGFEGAEAELFLYLPWDLPGSDGVLERARNAVVLVARSELAGLELPDVPGLRVGALLGPAEEPPSGTGEPPFRDETDPDGAPA